MKRIARAGHDIGNHGDHHKYMTRLSEEEQRREIQGAGDKAKALLESPWSYFVRHMEIMILRWWRRRRVWILCDSVVGGQSGLDGARERCGYRKGVRS